MKEENYESKYAPLVRCIIFFAMMFTAVHYNLFHAGDAADWVLLLPLKAYFAMI